MLEEVTAISNLGFAAYLLLKGYKLIGNPELDKASNRFIFNFEINKERHKELLYEYSMGDFAKFDSFVLNLKRMLPRPKRSF